MIKKQRGNQRLCVSNCFDSERQEKQWFFTRFLGRKLMAKKMCKKCKRLVTGDKCPVCQTDKLSESWKGRVIIIDADKSEIAKKMKLNSAGEYALR